MYVWLALVLAAGLLLGCTPADKAAINAAFAPIHADWERRTNENPFLGLDAALSGTAAAEQIRAIRALQRP